MPPEWKQHREPHQHGAIMILTLGFIPAVTITESGSIQLAMTLETDQNRVIIDRVGQGRKRERGVQDTFRC